MELHGVGDRWIAGHEIEGVAFAQGAKIRVVSGEYKGARGVVRLLMAVRPEARYLVQLDAERSPVRLPQSAMAAETAAERE